MALTATIAGTKVKIGDTVSVHYRIIEKEVVAGKTKKEKHEEQKERLQAFTGIVIAIRGAGENQSFIVRRIGIGGIGIERIYPVVSPWIKKITVKKKGDVRRAKLYYLRQKTSKEISKLAGEAVAEVIEENKEQNVPITPIEVKSPEAATPKA